MTKEKIIDGLVGAIISGIAFLTFSIYSDLLPKVMPVLLQTSIETYIKIVGLLLLLFVLLCFIALLLYRKTQEYKPLVLTGKDFGYNWSAEINYESKRESIEIELQWVCPQHKTFLGIKSAEVPETAYSVLWCRKCNRAHPMESGGDPVYVQEAAIIVKRNILAKLKASKNS